MGIVYFKLTTVLVTRVISVMMYNSLWVVFDFCWSMYCTNVLRLLVRPSISIFLLDCITVDPVGFRYLNSIV